MQLKEEEERIEEGEADTRKKMKAQRDHNKEWESTRENRVSEQRTPLRPWLHRVSMLAIPLTRAMPCSLLGAVYTRSVATMCRLGGGETL